MARSTKSGSKPAASSTKRATVAKTQQQKPKEDKATAAKAVKKATSGASRPVAAGTPARKRAPSPTSATKAVKPTGAAAATKAPPAKAANAKKPSGAAAKPAPPAKPAFGAKFLAQQEKSLLEGRENYTRQADSLRAEADALVADFEPGDVQFDEESGEGDTLNTERERDLALSAQARQAVEEITHALKKFADGTYGICEVSGDPIPVERLEAIPWARERVEYKTGGLGRR
ncbi:MAG: TraR/DksA C4-type zinc finger protein [Acidimicrobiales bacterium]